MSIEAMKQWKEALIGVLNIVSDSSGVACYHLNGAIAEWDSFHEIASVIDAIQDIEKAIEEAEKQEGWALREVLFADGEAIAHREPEKQEPVAIVMDAYDTPGLQSFCQHPPERGDRLYTAPQPTAQREWQGLTEADLSVCDEDGLVLARYWETKLREKNT